MANIIRYLLLAIVRLIGGICFIISGPEYFKRPRRCPKITDEILLIPACKLAAKIRKREITSEAVIKSYISRVKAVNPIINAVVEERFESAINDAKQIDVMISNTNLSFDELELRYPLLGLPLTVKESICVEGLSNCAAHFFPRGRKAVKDADVVELCKNAGAIPILVSNTPEFCFSLETNNKITGTTYNPYDTRRTPGGSSGGEAALLGSGASLIGLGSDICGSVRLPAHFCGIWSHKPTANIISVKGHYPSSTDKSWNEIFTLGPMTRYAQDLSLLFNVLLNEDHQFLKIDSNETINMPDIKFYYMENDGNSILSSKIERDITNALQNLVQYLNTRCQAKVKKVQSQTLKYSTELTYLKLISLEGLDDVYNNVEGGFSELLRYFTCRSNSEFLIILAIIIKKIFSSLHISVNKYYNKKLNKVKEELTKLLGSTGILLYPCHVSTANVHGQVFGKALDYGYTGVFNCIGFPVTTCPVGFDTKGLPIGLQIVSTPNNDRLTLAVAQEVEKAFGGWIPPPFQ